MEAFNLFNRVVWGAPNTDFNNTNFGLITAAGQFTAADAVRVEAVLVGIWAVRLQALGFSQRTARLRLRRSFVRRRPYSFPAASPHTSHRLRRAAALCASPRARASVTVERGDADRCRHRPVRDVFRDAGADALCEHATAASLLVFGAMTVNSSPPQRAPVSVARSSARMTRGDLAQRLAAGAVTVAIVDVLQSIEVEEEQAERLAVALRTLDLGTQPRRESRAR